MTGLAIEASGKGKPIPRTNKAPRTDKVRTLVRKVWRRFIWEAMAGVTGSRSGT